MPSRRSGSTATNLRVAVAAAAVLLVLCAARAGASAPMRHATPRSSTSSWEVRLGDVPAPPGETPHSGDIIRGEDGLYYWYGDSYTGFVFNRPSEYGGALVYRSTDLLHWRGPVAAFDADTPYWQRTCMGLAGDLDAGCFRSKVLFSPASHLYVMWISTPSGYRALTSRSPLGPFVVASTPDLHDAGIPGSRGQPCADGGDESLWRDHTGSYVVSNRCGRLLVERLSSDLLDGVGVPVQIDDYPEIGPFFGAEAPSLFRGRTGTYWIAFSLPACPYCAATTGLERARTALGPWHYAGRIDATSSIGQPNQVVGLGDGSWIDTLDLWRQPRGWPDVSEADARQRWEPLRFGADRIPHLRFTRDFTLRLRVR